MTQRYDLLSPRARKDKTFWVKIGAAFVRDKGGFSLQFDALPLPDAEGRVTVMMVEPRERTPDPMGAAAQTNGMAGFNAGGIDDEIPF